MMKKSIYHRFFEISKLYHFTSFEAACKIIKSGKLRFSKAYRLNDLIESNRVVWERTFGGYIPDGEEYLCYAEEEMRRYQQISFSQCGGFMQREDMGYVWYLIRKNSCLILMIMLMMFVM